MQTLLRDLRHSDVDMIFSWRNHKEIEKWTEKGEVSRDEHWNWYYAWDRSAPRWIFELNNNPVGFIHFKWLADAKRTLEWSYYLNPFDLNVLRANGLATIMLSMSLWKINQMLHDVKIIGRVKLQNLPSVRLHEKLGFKEQKCIENERRFIKWPKSL